MYPLNEYYSDPFGLDEIFPTPAVPVPVPNTSCDEELARKEQQIEADYNLALSIVNDQDRPASAISLRRSLEEAQTDAVAK